MNGSLNEHLSEAAERESPIQNKHRTIASDDIFKDGNTKKPDSNGKLVHVSSWADRKNWDKYNYSMPSVKELAKQFDESTQRKVKLRIKLLFLKFYLSIIEFSFSYVRVHDTI